MPFTVNQPLVLEVTPALGARAIDLTITPPVGGNAYSHIGQPPCNSPSGATHRETFTPAAAGTYSYAWVAKDGGGLVVGEASGTFDVVAPSPVEMTATVSAA